MRPTTAPWDGLPPRGAEDLTLVEELLVPPPAPRSPSPWRRALALVLKHLGAPG